MKLLCFIDDQKGSVFARLDFALPVFTEPLEGTEAVCSGHFNTVQSSKFIVEVPQSALGPAQFMDLDFLA